MMPGCQCSAGCQLLFLETPLIEIPQYFKTNFTPSTDQKLCLNDSFLQFRSTIFCLCYTDKEFSLYLQPFLYFGTFFFFFLITSFLDSYFLIYLLSPDEIAKWSLYILSGWNSCQLHISKCVCHISRSHTHTEMKCCIYRQYKVMEIHERNYKV